MSIRLILIDDEPLARTGVRARLQSREDFEVVAEASTVEDALKQISEFRPDAIFLDIEMAKSSGLDVARSLNRSSGPVIILLTAHRQYALEAFDVEAADYLLKPINDRRFEMSLDRIRERVALRRGFSRGCEPSSDTAVIATALRGNFSGRIAVTDRRKTYFIEASDVEWIGAAGDYTELHVQETTHLIREPITILLNRLPTNAFCRIHRSFVVNLSKVSEFITLRNQDMLVKLKDGAVLRASRTFSEELRNALLQR